MIDIRNKKNTYNNRSSRIGISKNQCSPFHIFAVDGKKFVFDTLMCRFYKIDDIVHEFLYFLQAGDNFADSFKRLKLSRKYSLRDIKGLQKEFSLLRKHGFMNPHPNFIDIDAVKQKILSRNCSDINDIQLILTDKCNLSCRYCYCSQQKHVCAEQRNMKSNIAQAVIDYFSKSNETPLSITFFGGEPTINKELIDFIMDYTNDLKKKTNKEFRYIITTNATILDDRIIDYIVHYNFGLMVSLDGPEDIHNFQCPEKSGKNSFQMAKTNIKKLMKRRSVGVRATMIHPMPNLKMLIDFFINFGFSNIAIAAATNRNDAPSDYDFTNKDMIDFSCQVESLNPWLLKYLLKNERPPYFIHEKWYSQIEKNDIHPDCQIFNCGACNSVIGVDPVGNYYPCAKFCGLKQWSVGNVATGINDSKCKDIWIKYIECISSRCGTCWAYPLCHGPCLWECARNDGTLEFDDKYCIFTKKVIECSAYLYFMVQNHQHDKPQKEEVSCTKKK